MSGSVTIWHIIPTPPPPPLAGLEPTVEGAAQYPEHGLSRSIGSVYDPPQMIVDDGNSIYDVPTLDFDLLVGDWDRISQRGRRKRQRPVHPVLQWAKFGSESDRRSPFVGAVLSAVVLIAVVAWLSFGGRCVYIQPSHPEAHCITVQLTPRSDAARVQQTPLAATRQAMPAGIMDIFHMGLEARQCQRLSQSRSRSR